MEVSALSRFKIVSIHCLLGLAVNHTFAIMLDPRLPFPDSVEGIFPGPATTQKVYQGIDWFSQLAATMNDS